MLCPNWCYTALEVKGQVSELKKFDTQFKGKYESYSGSSGRLNPDEDIEDYKSKDGCLEYRLTPHVKKYSFETDGMSDINMLTEINQEEGYSFNNFVRMTKDDFLNGWYEWSLEHWGTKWDLTDMSESNDLDAVADYEECELFYRFDTAWSPCIPVLIEMSKQYPDFEFKICYEDEGGGFVGVETYKAGEQTSELSPDSDDDYREFMVEYFDREYCKCNTCDALLEDYELEDNNHKCPHCNSMDILDSDGKQWVPY